MTWVSPADPQQKYLMHQSAQRPTFDRLLSGPRRPRKKSKYDII